MGFTRCISITRGMNSSRKYINGFLIQNILEKLIGVLFIWKFLYDFIKAILFLFFILIHQQFSINFDSFSCWYPYWRSWRNLRKDKIILYHKDHNDYIILLHRTEVNKIIFYNKLCFRLKIFLKSRISRLLWPVFLPIKFWQFIQYWNCYLFK